jgi:molybdopterin-containing oxidoreductase family membrane subunit
MTYTHHPGRSEGLALITSGPLSFNFWVGEIILGAIVPMILLLKQTTRQNRFWRMVALLLVVGGVVAYRWDVNLSGFLVVISYLPGIPTVTYASYTPSLIEIGAALGVIGFGLTAFSLGVRYLKVVDHRYAAEEHVAVQEEAHGTVLA